MGLDIYHTKATLEKPTIIDPHGLDIITEEGFPNMGFDVPFSHFDKYIQKIDYPKIIKKATLMKEGENLDDTFGWFNDGNSEIIFYENPDSLEQKTKEYELKNNLNKLHRNLSTNSETWDLLYHYEFIEKTGFYITDEGCQRKGMNADFNSFYQDDKYNFVLKEDFEKAYQCIDYYWEFDTDEELAMRRKNFKENFLDKYEFGASYLALSY